MQTSRFVAARYSRRLASLFRSQALVPERQNSVRVGPCLSTGTDPSCGIIFTNNCVLAHARSPDTSTSSTCGDDWICACLRAPRSPFSNAALPHIAGLPAIKNITSSVINERTPSTLPFAVYSCHLWIAARIAASSVCMAGLLETRENDSVRGCRRVFAPPNVRGRGKVFVPPNPTMS